MYSEQCTVHSYQYNSENIPSSQDMFLSSLLVRSSRLSCHSYSTISVVVESGLRTITLNRPEKFNAFNNQMYNEVLEDLNTAADDDSTVIAAITGAGRYFSSGNDLTTFSQVSNNLEERRQFSKVKGERLIKFVDAFIDFPKPIIGIVNGPAIGIGCTLLGLLDVVYASDR